MSHEIETAMFVGQPAWHGLGTILQHAPTCEDAIKAAGLDWKVKLEDLALKCDGRGVRHKATVRESDGRILGVVGPSFHPLQNVDAFNFFQPLIDDGVATLDAAGSLRDGQRVWVLAGLKTSADITKGDEIKQYALLAHGHDGSLAIRVGLTTVRVVCANTLRAALDSEAKLIKINHRKSAAGALEIVQGVLKNASANFEQTAADMRELARISCSDETLKSYVREVMKEGAAHDETIGKRTVGKVLELFESGRGTGLPGVRGTMWGAYNAMTEYLTHERGRTADARVESGWFGEGAALIDRSYHVAKKFAA